jgi:hypothetical protein
LSYFFALDEAVRPSDDLQKPVLKIESYGSVTMPPGFDQLTDDQQNDMVDHIAASLRHQWWTEFAKAFGFGLVITFLCSLAVYGVVRAIGWVIGGFMAS